MIGDINFSLYSSPTKAYGNVVGAIPVGKFIHTGDDISVLGNGFDDWFSGSLKVRSVHPSDRTGHLLIELEDVVAPTRDDAMALAAMLVGSGLFVDVYE